MKKLAVWGSQYLYKFKYLHSSDLNHISQIAIDYPCVPLSTFKSAHMLRNIRFLLTALILTALIPMSYASKNHKDDVQEMEKAKITLVEAINIAEKSATGKAISAKLKNSKQGLMYKVDVMDSDKKYEVKVDALSGAVISSNLDAH